MKRKYAYPPAPSPFIPKKSKPQPVNLDPIIDDVSVEAAKVLQELLYDAEDYIAVANIIIFLYSIEKTYGNLKTVQKNYQKLLDNYNEAAEHVDEIGIMEAYKQFHDKYGISIAFDDFDLNKVLSNQEIFDKLKIRINKGE